MFSLLDCPTPSLLNADNIVRFSVGCFCLLYPAGKKETFSFYIDRRLEDDCKMYQAKSCDDNIEDSSNYRLEDGNCES